MIWESCFWKDDLIKISEKLKEHYSKLKSDCKEENLVEFEKDIMISAYSIRKLFEAFKVSDETRKLKVSIRKYNALKGVNLLNWHRLEENYDSKFCNIKINLRKLCNTLIHSYCFIPIFGKYDNLVAFYFNSKEQKDSEIYSVLISEYCGLLKDVGNDYPTSGRFKYSKADKDYVIEAHTDVVNKEGLYELKPLIDIGFLSIDAIRKTFGEKVELDNLKELSEADKENVIYKLRYLLLEKKDCIPIFSKAYNISETKIIEIISRETGDDIEIVFDEEECKD